MRLTSELLFYSHYLRDELTSNYDLLPSSNSSQVAFFSVLLWPFRSIHNDINLLVTGFEVNDDYTEFLDGTFEIPLCYVSCVRDTVSESLCVR